MRTEAPGGRLPTLTVNTSYQKKSVSSGKHVREINTLLNPTFIYQRTNGPVNAHLRSASYTYLNIMVFNPSAGADEALGPFSFFRIINIPADFPLQITF